MSTKLLTERELCEFLRVSREAILRLRRDPVDAIPHMKVGRRFLYDEREVLKWATRNAKRERDRQGNGRGRWRA